MIHEFKDFPYEKTGAGLCGPRALQVVYNYHYGRTQDQMRIASDVGWTQENGTHPKEMCAHLIHNRLGICEFFGARFEDLTEFVNNPDYAVIVDFWDSANQSEDGEDCGHYDVPTMIIYDRIHFVDGTSYTKQEFMDRWHDYEKNDTGGRMRFDQYFIATYNPKYDRKKIN